MRKKITTAFLITLTSLLFLSCSKEDSTNDNLEVTNQNMIGKWYFKEVIKPDGSREPYIHSCSTKRDFAEIIYEKITIIRNSADCSNFTYDSCNDFYLNENPRKIFMCNDFFQGTISKFTATEMRLDYDEVETTPYIDNNMDISKGIILSRE